MVKIAKLSKQKRRLVLAYAVIFVLLLLAAIMYTVSVYKHAEFGDAQMDEIIYYIANGLNDGRSVNFIEALRDNSLLLLILFFLLSLPVIDFYRDRISIAINFATFGNNKTWHFNPSRVPIWLKIIYALLVFGLGAWALLASFRVGEYLHSLNQTGTVLEQHYVDPQQVALQFPAKKRNLIYIYMESMENTLGSRQNGGQMEPSRIPELEQLALDPANISFSNQPDGLGGAVPVSGTTWTVAAMTAQSSGAPLRNDLFGLGQNNQGQLRYFLPGSYGIGQVLEDEGYNQTFIMGSEATFGGRDKLLSQHGNYTILDSTELKKEGRLPADYSVWWGFEDRKLFDFARQEATRLAAEDAPFNLQLLTADTHFPDGYLDPTCPTPYARQYDNVHVCSSARVAEFVRWIQAQPFADNTTIVLTGDHLGMQTSYYDEIVGNSSYQRTVYNAFINSAITTTDTHGRLFSTYDMYPTTLAALGVEIPGDRLGLGVNLFSSRTTLVEKYGSYQALDAELDKRSEYYDTKLLRK